MNIQALSYDTSSLPKIFLPHLNTIKALKYFGTSYVTSIFAHFCLLMTYSELFSSVEHLLTMMVFDSSLNVENLCDKVLLTMMTFDSFSSVEYICDEVSLTRNSFSTLSSLDQTCEDGSFIYVITG